MEELEVTPRFNYGSKTLDGTSFPKKSKNKKKKDTRSSKSQNKKKLTKKSKSHYKSIKSQDPEKNQFYLLLKKTFKLRNDYDYEHSKLFLEAKLQAFEGYPFDFEDID